uniref:Uncharacterized protein n=1 Tax=Podoviridae sp. ctxqo3 TaxID=2827755 RepID=A0A8S5SYQ9_9CAUD|nr:MAG TPA: hypothetical protein [Podoviridae sp. ctxqo3]
MRNPGVILSRFLTQKIAEKPLFIRVLAILLTCILKIEIRTET